MNAGMVSMIVKYVYSITAPGAQNTYFKRFKEQNYPLILSSSLISREMDTGQ